MRVLLFFVMKHSSNRSIATTAGGSTLTGTQLQLDDKESQYVITFTLSTWEHCREHWSFVIANADKVWEHSPANTCILLKLKTLNFRLSLPLAVMKWISLLCESIWFAEAFDQKAVVVVEVTLASKWLTQSDFAAK